MIAEDKLRVRLPLGLGLAGLIPFVVGATAAYLAPMLWQALAVKAFVYYSAVLLSFLGGIHWGVAMSVDRYGDQDFNMRLAVATLPSLLAWPALLLDYNEAIVILMIGFWLIRLYERRQESDERLPGWYQELRSPLTMLVVICHLAVVARLTVFG